MTDDPMLPSGAQHLPTPTGAAAQREDVIEAASAIPAPARDADRGE